ncbi:hypothetical protein GGF39_003681 [Coemansia sp. RSA 1721]|nr:hypothetical protein GGF39_003681 [Coemansia sp. RSA 1721]
MTQTARFLPEEMVLKIGWYVWFNQDQYPRNSCNSPGYDSIDRFKQLCSRNTSILSVCQHWRRALLPAFCRAVQGDCQMGSAALPHPFIKKGLTKEVWLRFDGYLLFGKWAIELVSNLLNHGQSSLSIDSLVIIIVNSPPTLPTYNEIERARLLIDICQRALMSRSVAFVSQPQTVLGSNIRFSSDSLDKFQMIYTYFSLAPHPPCVTLIEVQSVASPAMVQFISSTARTLERLRIKNISIATLQLLLKGAKEVVFPRLEQLQLVLDTEGVDIQPYNITTQLFPRLACLDIIICPSDIGPSKEASLSIYEHNFLTDLFFHDSARTRLRSLNLPVTWDTVEVLDPKLLENLRYVFLYEVSLEGEHLLDEEESNQLLQNILSLQHVRSVFLTNSAPRTFINFPLQCHNLHTLGISNYSLTVDQVVDIIKHFRFLYFLEFSLINDVADKDPGAVPAVQLRKYGSALNTSMKNMRANIVPETTAGTVALFGSFIVALPHLQCLTIPRGFCGLVGRSIKYACEKQPYKWGSEMQTPLNIFTI